MLSRYEVESVRRILSFSCRITWLSGTREDFILFKTCDPSTRADAAKEQLSGCTTSARST